MYIHVEYILAHVQSMNGGEGRGGVGGWNGMGWGCIGSHVPDLSAYAEVDAA